MTENEFFEQIKDRIVQHLPEGYENSRVELHAMVKNNDMHLTGITVIPAGESGSPLIYLNDYYKQAQGGRDTDEICDEIVGKILSYRDIGEKVSNLDLGYESIKDKLRVKVVNAKSNRELLKNVISRAAGCGYVLVPYIDLEHSGFPGGCIQITNEMAESFGHSRSEILADAVAGSVREDGAGLFRLEDVLFGPGEPANLLGSGSQSEKEHGPFVLTNTASGLLGASALFLPDVQKQIADTLGSGYYVMPSSVHEVLVVPDREDVSPKELVQMVKEVNSAIVAPEEQMGARVLHYDAALGKLYIAADLDRSREQER